MKKQHLNGITWGFVGATVLLVILMMSTTLRRPVSITLPETSESSGQSAELSGSASGTLTVIEVRPDTVQAAISALSRPEVYRRTVTVEQFWGNSSGTYEIEVTVNEDWTRTDRTMPDGRVRHTITGVEDAFVWYSRESKVYTVPIGTVSADHEQSIPTYEDILQLPSERITAADYRSVSGVNCIYVETAEDEGGYALRYWVSVDTGLLVMAEKVLDEMMVYSMRGLTVEEVTSLETEFTLPDGTVLL